jgi:hypothetical protein
MERGDVTEKRGVKGDWALTMVVILDGLEWHSD